MAIRHSFKIKTMKHSMTRLFRRRRTTRRSTDVHDDAEHADSIVSFVQTSASIAGRCQEEPQADNFQPRSCPEDAQKATYVWLGVFFSCCVCCVCLLCFFVFVFSCFWLQEHAQKGFWEHRSKEARKQGSKEARKQESK